MGGARTPGDGWVGGAQAGLDLPSLQLKAVIAMETDGANMNEAQEGLVVFFFGKIYILFISSYKEIL